MSHVTPNSDGHHIKREPAIVCATTSCPTAKTAKTIIASHPRAMTTATKIPHKINHNMFHIRQA